MSGEERDFSNENANNGEVMVAEAVIMAREEDTEGGRGSNAASSTSDEEAIDANASSSNGSKDQELEKNRLSLLLERCGLPKFVTYVDRHAGIKSSDASGTAGDLTLNSIVNVVMRMMEKDLLNEEDKLLDIGCGFCKPGVVCASVASCRVVGVDHDPHRVNIARGGFLDVLWKNGEGEGGIAAADGVDLDRLQLKTYVFVGEATKMTNYADATVLWSFDAVFDDKTMEAIATAVKNTPTLRTLVLSLRGSKNPREFFDVHDVEGFRLVDQISCIMSGSSSAKTMLLFERVESESADPQVTLLQVLSLCLLLTRSLTFLPLGQFRTCTCIYGVL